MTEREYAQARRRELCRQEKAAQTLLASIRAELVAIERYLGCEGQPVRPDASATVTPAPAFALPLVAAALDAVGE